MFTQKELKRVLRYDPETGEFTWKVSKGTAHAGSVAGHLHSDGYTHIGINGKIYKAHRLAWLYVHGKWPKDQIDHINHVRNDNRISNLREASNKDNGLNQKLHKTNSSGVSGVYPHTPGRWKSSIMKNGKLKHLGHFDSFKEAVAARKSAEKAGTTR